MPSSRGSSVVLDDESFHDSPITPQSPVSENELKTTSSLKGLQTEEQQRVLDTVAHLRKCGLENTLPLPQLVVCGDQSAGSVLEALTEIPFPRNDNLCTRFATEISLRNADTKTLTIKIIPDDERPSKEQAMIKEFVESITDFDDLPRIMDLAMEAMGITAIDPNAPPRAFARDVLSIEFCGPDCPQLTLVDLPGLIASETVEATAADVETVAAITEHYIKQPRTICLAVISAKNDIANQQILKRPDTLDKGSGNEKAFISLAKNENVRFRLGWHVVKNRRYEERDFSLMERNMAEDSWFRASNFKTLSKNHIGIERLRGRLAALLFQHIKKELPQLRRDLEIQLFTATEQLGLLGDARSTPSECRAYLVQLSTDVQKICAAAVDGHYEGRYFQCAVNSEFRLDQKATLRRMRACVQTMNSRFTEEVRRKGHKYQIDDSVGAQSTRGTMEAEEAAENGEPERLTKKEGLDWVRQALTRTRGKELPGNFNPSLISELFWEQSARWEELAAEHIERVSDVDVESRLWSSRIEDELRNRNAAATQELDNLIVDNLNHPINYNHYYTDTIKNRQQERANAELEKCCQDASAGVETSEGVQLGPVIERLRESLFKSTEKDMEVVSCEAALDCVMAIYKVLQKVFIANVTTQVVERHIVRGLERIFDPVAVNKMSDKDVEAIASEPGQARQERAYLEDQIKKLGEGKRIFRTIMSGATTL
ncbi:dynamin family protein [Botrytis cinerea]